MKPPVTPLEAVRSIEDLSPNPLVYERTAFMAHIRRYDREALRAYYGRQKSKAAPVWANYAVNLWEYEHGVEELTSRPWNVTIPITEVCNAKCDFCSSPLVPQPKALAVHEVEHFADSLGHALRVSLQGLGEPLAHPQFEELAAAIRKHLNKAARLEIITNGWLLSGRRWELLKSLQVRVLQVSVNAATDRTHQIAMGSKPGTFDRVLDNIEQVLSDPSWRCYLKASMVITRHSLPEVPQFLEVLAKRGVKHFQFNALLPLTSPDWGFGRTRQYIDLWCGHLPDAAALVEEGSEAIARYREMGHKITATPEQWLDRVEQWQTPELIQLSTDERQTAVFQDSAAAAPTQRPDGELAPVEGDGSSDAPASGGLECGPLDAAVSAPPPEAPADGTQGTRPSRVFCPMVYTTLSVFHHSLDVSTCCYMETPGPPPPNLTRVPIDDAYNDRGFRLVRRTLNTDRHVPVCDTCTYGTFRSP